MNSFAQIKRSVTIGSGSASSDIWKDLQSKEVLPTDIVSFTAQRSNLTLILLEHNLLREIDFPQW